MPRLAVLFFALSAAMAQDAPRLSFEVDSVKPVPEDAGVDGHYSTGMAPPIDPHAKRIDFPHVSLIGIVCQAYDVKPLDIRAPDWMRDHRYMVAAKVPADAPEGHIPEMLQGLLANRFQMKLHWETKEEQGYSLTVAKGGPKLKESEAGPKRRTGFRSNGHIDEMAATMSDLAHGLSIFMGRTVVNSTDLPGTYDISLDAAPDSMPGFTFSDGKDSNFPTIFAALHQLGLELVPGKVVVRHLVIDSALKVPAAN